MPILLYFMYLNMFRRTAAIYNIQGTGLPYGFTAEKPQAVPHNLL